MDLMIIIILSLCVFLFIVYIPTILFYNYSKSKGKKYSLLLFFGASLLFLLFNYMCFLFYNLRTYNYLSECVSSLSNYNCFFSKYLSRAVDTSVSVIMVFIIQILSFALYAYITVKNIMTEKKEKKVIIYIFVFFICGISCSELYYLILYDVNFLNASQIIWHVGANAFIILPLFYLIIITILNKNMLILKKNNKF